MLIGIGGEEQLDCFDGIEHHVVEEQQLVVSHRFFRLQGTQSAVSNLCKVGDSFGPL